jgi:tetratricopeptide (TPR) repeat protein
VDIISENVAGAMVRDLTGEERKRLTKHYTNNLAAHQLYTKGRYLWDEWTRDATLRALERYQQANAIDPNYALAYAGLADCYVILGIFSDPEHEMFPKAKAAAAKALALDETLAEAHASLAVVAHLYDWDFASSENEFRRALELDPNNALAHHWHGNYLLSMGRIDEALAEGRRSIELDPTSLRINSIRKPGFQKDLAIVYARLGEKDRALACLYKAYEEHDPWLVWIKVAPFYDNIRSDPRFTELVRKVGLPL